MAQTWPHKEIIIIDDGSTDGSLSIIKKYTNDWIRVYPQNNQGAAAARNKGLEKATGNYIQFLDADDLLDENKITAQVKLLQAHPGKISVCSTVHFPDGSNHLDFKPSAYEDSFLIDNDPLPFIINLWGGITNKGSMIQPNAWLTPKTVIDKAGLWNEKITLDDDGEFFCRVMLASDGIVVAPGAFNYYRKNIALSQSGHRDIKSLQSLYQSINLKHQHLMVFKDEMINKVICRSLMSLLVYTYPQHRQLSRQIMADIKKMGGPVYYPVLGGKTIMLFSKIFGWKTARRAQYYYSKLIRR